MVALWNDMRLAYNRPPLGFINPFLYDVARRAPEAFNDVVSQSPSTCANISMSRERERGGDCVSRWCGVPCVCVWMRAHAFSRPVLSFAPPHACIQVLGDNACGAGDGIENVHCCPYAFSAVPGWDAVTGLGTPNFQIIANLVVDGDALFPNSASGRADGRAADTAGAPAAPAASTTPVVPPAFTAVPTPLPPLPPEVILGMDILQVALVLFVLAAVTVQVIWCYRACCLATTTPEPPSDPSHVHVNPTVTHPGRRDSDVVTQRRETAFGIPLGRASTNAGYQSLEMAPSR
jgi:hypothetical protein